MKLIYSQDQNTTGTPTNQKSNQNNLEKISGENYLDLPSAVEVLTQYLMHNSIQTKVAVLKWIYDLYKKMPRDVFLTFYLKNNFL